MLSFTQASLIGKVSGSFTRDQLALAGYLAALARVAYPLDLAVAWAPAGFGGNQLII